MSTRRGFVGFPSEERIDREDGMATRPAGFTGFAGFAGFTSEKSIDMECGLASRFPHWFHMVHK